MTFRALALFTALIALSGSPSPAQMACAERAGVVAKLDAKYGETQRGRGLAFPGAVFEVWASEATGTWTILKTTPNGWACVVAVGEDWLDFGPPKPGEAS